MNIRGNGSVNYDFLDASPNDFPDPLRNVLELIQSVKNVEMDIGFKSGGKTLTAGIKPFISQVEEVSNILFG